MSDELIELCPICIESPVTYFTECNHGYCIGCLCRIKKCAMCRKSLLRSQLCIQIKQKVKLIGSYRNPLIFNNREDFGTRVTATIDRDGGIRTRTYINVTLPAGTSVTEDSYVNSVTPDPTNGTTEGINAYNVALLASMAEWHAPSHAGPSFSRVDNAVLHFNHPIRELVWFRD